MAEGISNVPSQGHTHINKGFQYEDSDSEDSSDLSDGLSESSDENAFDPEWADNVTANGELFYVEAVPAVKSETPVANGSPLVDKSVPKSKSRPRRWMQRGGETVASSNKNFSSRTETSASKVTFRASPNGDVKEVVLDVDPRRHNYGRRATPCEVLFGIIPSDFDESARRGDSSDSRVMVQGFVPNGEALKSGVIKIGDWLRKIDGVDVNLENLSLILGSITTPRKVKLEVQRFAGHSGRPNPFRDPENSFFGKEMIISCSRDIDGFCQVPHILLYLGDGSTSEDEDYILYKYPNYDSSLLALNGMFITLNHMVTDVTSLPPLCSSVIVDNQIIHVSFHQEERNLMVLAFPASCISRLEIQHLISSLGRLLRWQYKSLTRAFSEKENKAALDKLVSQFCSHIMSPLSNQPNHALLGWQNYFNVVPWLPLNGDLQIHLESLLSEFESGDFGDMSEAYYDTQRLYTILGSCLFYKGVLCTSHLQKDDLIDIYWYAFYHQLLRMTSQKEVSQVVVWREVFPTRWSLNNSASSSNADFREERGRCFLLAVALKSSLFCTLLETGGCSLKAEGRPPPDPFYVDQARAVLLKMESLGLTSQVDKSVESHLAPELVSADWFLIKNKQPKKPTNKDMNMSRSSSLQTLSRKDGLGQRSASHSSLNASGQWLKNESGIRKKQDVTSILKKRLGTDAEKEHLIAPSSPPDMESDGDGSLCPTVNDDSSGAMGSYDLGCQTSASSNSDADSRASYDSEIYRMKSQRIFASSYDLNNIRKCFYEMQLDGSEAMATKLTAGCENVLFQYISVDVAEGVLLTPTEQSQQWLQGPMHREILKNFHKCVIDIRHVLHCTHKSQESLCNRDLSPFSVEPSLAPVKEHGVLFNFVPSPANNNPKKTQPSVDYWVVGRLFHKPEHKEVYVCFQDSASQNAVELAFKLSFGLLI